MKRFLRGVSTFLLLTILLTTGVSAESFKDVSRDNWYYEPVMELTKLGSIKGYGDSTFKPGENITFAEFIKIALISITKKDYPMIMDAHFGMTYYRELVRLEVFKENEFMDEFKDMDELFNQPLTRDDMAYIVVRLDEIIKENRDVDVKHLKDTIEDFDLVTPSRKKAVLQAYGRGLVKGIGNKFYPKEKTTRAEACQIIIRLINR